MLTHNYKGTIQNTHVCFSLIFSYMLEQITIIGRHKQVGLYIV
jgi:hypothetical protein